MKTSLLSRSIFVFCIITVAFSFTACDKIWEKEDCPYMSKYIYEDLIYDDNCDCIVAGKVKYLKDCTTVALVDYGDGTCDNIAHKTICVKGKCEAEAGATVHEYLLNDCVQEAFDESVSANEATFWGLD